MTLLAWRHASGRCWREQSKFTDNLRSKDWDNQGLLLVDLDSSPWDRGKPALLRLDVSNVPAILMQLELSNANFADFKAAELATGWPDPIEGYTDTNLQTGGQDVASGGTLKKTGNHPKPFGLGVGFE